MSVTVLTISTLSHVGSKMVPGHLFPGTASYQCLFHLKNKQKKRRFGFKRGEWRWENQYWGEGFTLSLCQVLPSILSACPQPWTLNPAHWFHPSNHGDHIYRHPSAQALKQLSYIKETRLSWKIETELVPPAASEEPPGSPAEKSLNPGSLIALRKRGEPESPRQLLGGQDRQI